MDLLRFYEFQRKIDEFEAPARRLLFSLCFVHLFERATSLPTPTAIMKTTKSVALLYEGVVHTGSCVRFFIVVAIRSDSY